METAARVALAADFHADLERINRQGNEIDQQMHVLGFPIKGREESAETGAQGRRPRLYQIHSDGTALRSEAGRILMGSTATRLVVGPDGSPAIVTLDDGQGLFSGLRILGQAKQASTEGRLYVDFDRLVFRSGRIHPIKGTALADDGGYGLKAQVLSSKALMIAGSIASSFISGYAASQQTTTQKRPEILTREEIRSLLRAAREQQHAWYPIWVAAVLTGCRSGELHQLRVSDLEIISREQAIEEDKKPFDRRRYGFLRVRRSWNVRMKAVGPTKAGYWRNVPVSSEFYWFLVHDLQTEKKRPDDFLLPRCWEWNKGFQARILRGFCIGNRLPSIRFHTLRACFATQLISTGIPATVVMKICGWKDLKTMQRYIRLAGIDEAGATETLRFIPTEAAVMEKVVDLFEHKVRLKNP